MKPLLKFSYSHHWRSWSRVLSFDPITGEFIELNLTHINGNWDRVKQEWFRVHRVPRPPTHIGSNALPTLMQSAMDAMIGKPLANKLINYDYLPEIDIEKHRIKLMDSGAPFSEIRRIKPYTTGVHL